MKIKDLIFENANFNLNTKNYNFFVNLLKKILIKIKLIKNSNIFF